MTWRALIRRDSLTLFITTRRIPTRQGWGILLKLSPKWTSLVGQLISSIPSWCDTPTSFNTWSQFWIIISPRFVRCESFQAFQHILRGLWGRPTHGLYAHTIIITTFMPISWSHYRLAGNEAMARKMRISTQESYNPTVRYGSAWSLV